MPRMMDRFAFAARLRGLCACVCTRAQLAVQRKVAFGRWQVVVLLPEVRASLEVRVTSHTGQARDHVRIKRRKVAIGENNDDH